MANKTLIAEPEGNDTFAGTPELEDPDTFFAPEPEAPVYDPTMDPSHRLWNPKKYFDAQDKVTIIVHRDRSDMIADPTNKRKIMFQTGINGYTLEFPKGVPVRVPRDFAVQLVKLKMASVFSDIDTL